MDPNQPPLELLHLLNLPASTLSADRLLRWAAAFDAWLGERRARFGPRAAVDALNAWREFLALTHQPPWQATAADVEAYAQTLKKRKLRPGTISHRLTRLTKFYEYCQAHRTDPQCPSDFNPVAGVSRPRRLKLEKARYLTRSEEAALLDAIRRDPSPLGQRDYALFLLLLRTGWKAGDVRQLKWEDLSWGAAAESAAGEQAGGEGECRRKETLTEEVREAIREYLEASGRMARMLPGDYLFAPSRQALVREAGDRAEDWDAGRPISAGDLLYLLKLHAQRAGLTAARITCHTLRHTAVIRQVEAGASPEAVADMLGVERLDSVKDYLERLAGKPKGRLRARKRLDPATGELVPPGSQDIPSRGPCRAGPRNHLGLKHGFYARYLPEFEWLAEDGNEPQGMDRAIMRWRIVMRRILIVGDGVDNLKDAMRYLKLTGLASHRLCKALKFQQQMRDLQVQLQWAAFFEVRRRK